MFLIAPIWINGIKQQHLIHQQVPFDSWVVLYAHYARFSKLKILRYCLLLINNYMNISPKQFKG